MPKPRQTPHLRPETGRVAALRRDKLAAALRANLARRKAQGRERAAQVRALQNSMADADAVKAVFETSDLENLMVVVRLTVEFHAYLKSDPQDDRDSADFDRNYACDSIFAGIDCYTSLAPIYRILVGAETKSRLRWDDASISSLKQQFLSLYEAFVGETVFLKRCRQLLDLFKLQIAMAGMMHE